MSFFDIAGVMLKRWYVLLIVLAVSGGLWYVWSEDGGCFTTSTVVSFTLPARATLLPESGVDDASVIAFAGVVANEINGGRPAPRYASRDAPLYGVGVRQGVIVGLPDSGSQWASSFARAEIEIQIVGRSYQEVQTRQAALLTRVFEIARQQQGTASSKQQIRASVVPLTTVIQEVTSSRSSRLLSAVAMSFSALLVSGWAAVRLDRWSAARAQKSDAKAGQDSEPTMDEE